MCTMKSNIHLFFDFWTSSNSIVFVTIIAHFIDDSACLCIMLICLCHIIGLYTEEVITEQMIQVIQEYGYKKQLGYFFLDDATNNYICVTAILQKL